MNHAEFVDAWRAGAVSVEVDPAKAMAFVSARLLLPFVAVAVIGLGIAVVLWGWMWLGLTIGALGIVVPRLIKRGAGGFLLAHIADDAALFEAALRTGAVRVIAAGARMDNGPSPAS